MVFNNRKKINVSGDFRYKRRFLFWPKEINGVIKWLELSKYTQIYQVEITQIGSFSGWEDYCWGYYKKT